MWNSIRLLLQRSVSAKGHTVHVICANETHALLQLNWEHDAPMPHPTHSWQHRSKRGALPSDLLVDLSV